MVENRIVNSLPELWRNWFMKYVKLEKLVGVSNNILAGVAYENSNIVFLYNPDTCEKLNDEDLKNLVSHEMAHIIRGDIMLSPNMYNTTVANMATDAIINDALKITKIGDIEGTTIEGLKDTYTNIPDIIAGWRSIYDAIMENGGEGSNRFDILIPSNLTPEEKEEYRNKINQLICEDPNILKSKLVKVKSAAPTTKIDIIIKKSALLESIISAIKSHMGNKKRIRSYRKQHPTCDMLRGNSNKPFNKILLVLDVSGSYVSYTNILLGLLYWFKKTKKMIYQTAVFSDNFYVVNDLKNVPNYGGSTHIGGLFKHLEHNLYDLVIVFTDGYIYDYTQEMRNRYKGKILWVLDNDKHKSKFSVKDKVLINDQVLKTNKR
jgi:predicted metal-dependent peptidase